MRLLLIPLLLVLAQTTHAQVYGQKDVAVLFVNFSDKQLQPWSPEQIQYAINAAAIYYNEVSYGQMSFAATTFGYYTIPLSSSICDRFTLASQARSAATAAGVNLSNYSYTIYAFPKNACAWSGLSTTAGFEGWYNGYFDLQQIAHEFGHNLGLGHAKSDINGVISEYGDQFDAMGSRTAHYNASHKERLGWLAVPLVTTGTYQLDPLENPAGLRALKVRLNPTTFYYLEKRNPVGFDGFIATSEQARSGVLLHRSSPSEYWSYLLNTLLPGQSFTDPAADIRITVLSADDTGALVNVGPAASLTPLSADQTAPTISITAPIGSVKNKQYFSFTVNAADNVAVQRVRFYVNQSDYGADYAAPYTLSTAIVNGKRGDTVTLRAEAFDASGNMATATSTVTIK